MFMLSCKDLDPTTTCDFQATGETTTEVAEKMMAHAKMEHMDKVDGMSDAELMATYESKVHE